MADEIVKVENGGAQIALGRFATNLQQRAALLKEIATGMLVSVRRTFREQGSPENSWPALAASTLRKKPNGPGRKILIVSGRLLNSIQATSDDRSVVIGTNLVYARVQQEGSADRGGGLGPQARIAGRSVDIGAHRRTVRTPLPVGKHEITDKRGRRTTVRAAFQGPVLERKVEVSAHTRFQNIPGRPYLVFRPEDPARIQGQVIAFGIRAAEQAGLATGRGKLMAQNLQPQACIDALVTLLSTFLKAQYDPNVDVQEIAKGDFDEQGQLILKKVAVRVVFGEAVYGQARDVSRTMLSVTMPFAIACRHESLRSGKEMRGRSLALAECVQTYLAGARLQQADGSLSEPILLRGVGLARDTFGPVEDTYAVTIEVSGYSQFPGTYAQPGSQAVVA